MPHTTTPQRYNHAFDIAFSIISNDPEGNDITPAQFSAALRARADRLDQNPGEWLEAAGAPFETHPEEDVTE
jgi:hypothetical protein